MIPNRINFVLDSVSATGTDNFKLDGQFIVIGTSTTTQVEVCRLLDVQPKSFKKTVAVAETLQAQVVTFTGTTNSITYGLSITQLDPVSENFITVPITLTTPAVGTISPTTIGDQFRTAINSNPQLHIAATGTTTLILTAETGYATFSIDVTNAGLGTSVAAASPAGVYPFGKTPYYDLQRVGLTSSDYAGSTAGYTKYTWFADNRAGETNYDMTRKPVQVNLFINTDDADAAALITSIDAVFASASYQAGEFEIP